MSTKSKAIGMMNREAPGSTGGRPGRGGNAPDMFNGTGMKARSHKLTKAVDVRDMKTPFAPRLHSMAKTMKLGPKK